MIALTMFGTLLMTVGAALMVAGMILKVLDERGKR